MEAVLGESVRIEHDGNAVDLEAIFKRPYALDEVAGGVVRSADQLVVIRTRNKPAWLVRGAHVTMLERPGDPPVVVRDIIDDGQEMTELVCHSAGA
jgi:hypothetical protein